MDVPLSKDGLIIDDVWSRTAPKYRARAVILLVLNMLLFGAMCCFMFWLRTGWYFSPAHPNYTRLFVTAAKFSGAGQVTAYNLVTEPISLEMVPMHAVVIGLLIASLASIPILVAILYRFAAALPFCAMVGVLAVMPWLSANLVLACLIAHVARKRVRFRFAAALLALIPIGIYLLVSSQTYSAPQDLLTSPFDRGLVVVPLLLSVVASCVLMAGCLSIARIVDYRPGAITPLLALMLLAPWALFMDQVGPHELHYRILEMNYGPESDDFFAPANAESHIELVAKRLHRDHPEPRPALSDLKAEVLAHWEREFEPLDDDKMDILIRDEMLDQVEVFAEQQYIVRQACDQFLEAYEDSRYVPSVLYIKGRALDMRVDRSEFRNNGNLRYYHDCPGESSRSTWTKLVTEHPQSPLADVARMQLARLDARRGDVQRAIDWLSNMSTTVRVEGDSAGGGGLSLEQLLQKRPPEASLESEYVDMPRLAHELRALLENNRDPLTGDAPLVAYLNCDSRHPEYLNNLRLLLKRFEARPDMRIRDNIELELAIEESLDTAELVRRIEDIRRRFPHGDVEPLILYELARGYDEMGELNQANEQFKTLADEYPWTPQGAAARRWLYTGRPQEP